MCWPTYRRSICVSSKHPVRSCISQASCHNAGAKKRQRTFSLCKSSMRCRALMAQHQHTCLCCQPASGVRHVCCVDAMRSHCLPFFCSAQLFSCLHRYICWVMCRGSDCASSKYPARTCKLQASCSDPKVTAGRLTCCILHVKPFRCRFEEGVAIAARNQHATSTKSVLFCGPNNIGRHKGSKQGAHRANVNHVLDCLQTQMIDMSAYAQNTTQCRRRVLTQALAGVDPSQQVYPHGAAL